MTEDQDILEQCFGRLSEVQRACISGAYLEGLTHDGLSVSVNSPVAYAVSLEPSGGSTQDVPTGPVLYQGLVQELRL